MGSRLKGKRSRKSNEIDKRIVFKLVIYCVIGIAVIALLWGLWLSKTGFEKVQQNNYQKQASSNTGS